MNEISVVINPASKDSVADLAAFFSEQGISHEVRESVIRHYDANQTIHTAVTILFPTSVLVAFVGVISKAVADIVKAKHQQIKMQMSDGTSVTANTSEEVATAFDEIRKTVKVQAKAKLKDE